MAGFAGLDELFGGRHFDREVIVLCVRWYLRFKLSYRDLVEMMAERGLSLVHTTIMRWVPIMLQSLNAAGAGSPGRPGLPGVSMRPTSRSAGNGTGRSTARGNRGLPAEWQARCRRGQGVLSQGHQEPGIDSTDHHIGPSHWTVTRRRIGAVREMKTDGQMPADTKVRSSKYLRICL
jgi:hypothetical protein